MTEVWYAAYGSNTLGARFDCYLRGGSFLPGQPPHAGCRDPSPATASAVSWVPGQMIFAGSAARWGGGGVSFLRFGDPATTALVRLWAITAEQLIDVQAQECGRAPGSVVADLPTTSDPVKMVVEARYGTLVHLGERDGAPIVTFTGEPPEPCPSAPHESYVATIAAGLVEAGASQADVDAYLSARTSHALGSGTDA